MELLTFNFLIYTFSGVWRPLTWSSNGAKLLYGVFTFFAVIPLYFMMITQFIDIAFIIDNIDDFATNSLIFISIISVCCKATVVIIRREAIIDLVQTLLKDPCKPRDETEMAIRMKFDEFIRSGSIKYLLLATSSVTTFTIRSVLNVMHGDLPLRAWLPYNNKLTYWIMSIHQIIHLIIATYINVGSETLIFGFFLQTCVQLEIFEHRLRKLTIHKASRHQQCFSHTPCSNEEAMLSEHIHHHLRIYKYAKTVNKVFSQILFFQFCGSILVLCTSLYYISTHGTESEAMTLLSYTACMYVQILVYCWSGNEVILKSTNIGNTIYHMDWHLLSVSEKKDLLMIMRRSTIPIKFTSSFLITFSLESYSNILKTSYSAFNVLQQS